MFVAQPAPPPPFGAWVRPLEAPIWVWRELQAFIRIARSSFVSERVPSPCHSLIGWSHINGDRQQRGSWMTWSDAVGPLQLARCSSLPHKLDLVAMGAKVTPAPVV